MAYAAQYRNMGMFLVVRDGGNEFNEEDTILIQSDWEFPSLASAMGWQACECGGTDGTVPCKKCGREVGEMISEASDFITDNEGVNFESLDEYFDNN